LTHVLAHLADFLGKGAPLDLLLGNDWLNAYWPRLKLESFDPINLSARQEKKQPWPLRIVIARPAMPDWRFSCVFARVVGQTFIGAWHV
jgi:hypothetical protein